VNRGIPTESARNGEIPKIQTPLFGTMRHAALSDLFVQTFPSSDPGALASRYPPPLDRAPTVELDRRCERLPAAPALELPARPLLGDTMKKPWLKPGLFCTRFETRWPAQSRTGMVLCNC
ncbi:hypothetical protein EI541_23155, partial [Xanthomonas citri pv. eucalyptorum]